MNKIDALSLVDSLRSELKYIYEQEIKVRKEWDDIVSADLARFRDRRVEILHEIAALQAIK